MTSPTSRPLSSPPPLFPLFSSSFEGETGVALLKKGIQDARKEEGAEEEAEMVSFSFFSSSPLSSL